MLVTHVFSVRKEGKGGERGGKEGGKGIEEIEEKILTNL